eukprot:3856408-Lingulodinium_polyedra.AAC.1
MPPRAAHNRRKQCTNDSRGLRRNTIAPECPENPQTVPGLVKGCFGTARRANVTAQLFGERVTLARAPQQNGRAR